MQKITPCLWYQGQAEEALNRLTSLFDNSAVHHIERYPEGRDEPYMKNMEGKILTAIFEAAGHRFMSLDGSADFKFTPAISFFVNCETEDEIDTLWRELANGGNIMMPFQEYPFSKKFGWCADKYGVSWQLSLAPREQKISPFLMFVGEQDGKAEEAINFYTSLFDKSSIESIRHQESGTVEHALFKLNGQEFMAIDGGTAHDFGFNEAISLYVECETQDEVDHFWNNLSVVPESEQCGWLKDKYGVSWQIVPKRLGELMGDPDPEKAGRVMNAMLQMKKIDVAELEKAYAG